MFQVVEDGYEFFAKRQLVTLFSAPNYCGEFDNAGAMMSVDDTLMCSFQVSFFVGGVLIIFLSFFLDFETIRKTRKGELHRNPGVTTRHPPSKRTSRSTRCRGRPCSCYGRKEVIRIFIFKLQVIYSWRVGIFVQIYW